MLCVSGWTYKQIKFALCLGHYLAKPSLPLIAHPEIAVSEIWDDDVVHNSLHVNIEKAHGVVFLKLSGVAQCILNNVLD